MFNRQNPNYSLFNLTYNFVSGSLNLAKYILNNSDTLVTLYLVGTSFIKSQAQTTNTNMEQFSGELYQPFGFYKQCSAFDEAFYIQPNIEFYADQLFDTIGIETQYKNQLSIEEQTATRKKIFNIMTVKIGNDSEKAHRLYTVINSNNFKITIVDQFEEMPEGAGMYEKAKNTLFLRDPLKLKCDDFSTTVGHELHHSYMGVLNSDGDPITVTATLKSNESVSYPFNNHAEQVELWAAIVSGNNFITRKFANWHRRANAGKLNATELQIYNSYANLLSNYDVRCAGEFFPTSANMKAQPGDVVPTRAGYKIFVTGIMTLDIGIGVLGNLVRNPEQQKIEAFILDADYKVFAMQRDYRSRQFVIKRGINPDYLITSESDAEINALPTSIIEKFYPDVVRYHEKFGARKMSSSSNLRFFDRRKLSEEENNASDKLTHKSHGVRKSN